jgi:hypothetical protein
MSQALIKIARDGKSIGEYSLTDLGLALRAKTVLLSDYYWRPGMKDWERVQLIVTEAEGAVTLTASSAPTPPSAGMETKEITANSPMSRLHLTIGAFDLVYSLCLFLYGIYLGVVLSREVARGPASARPFFNPEVYSRIDKTSGELLIYAALILGAFIVSKLTYFIVLGKRREADNKPIKTGDAFFIAAIVIGFGAFIYVSYLRGLAWGRI